MLITRIELENIKSYRQICVDFRRGTTAISGSNGAGKTTLVEAIGFALFGFLPYNQEQFVREGEKYGKIVVHLVAGDDRPYTVERRCGSGARWLVHDIEADMRLEQRADVLDKLHDLFGIDRERPLDSLFRDALGVPQGTFTSIFLDAASKRKQTFDALLQIEDYKTAADILLDTQKQYRDQMQAQQLEMQRLEIETRELDEWRSKIQDARLLDKQQKEQNVQWSQQLTHHEERALLLNEQSNQLNALEQRYQNSKTIFEHAQQLLSEREQQLQAARAAQQIVTSTHNDYQRYQQAESNLKQLRQQAQKRDVLRSELAELQNVLAKVDERAQSLQGRLDEVAAARLKVVELAPLVEQQVELEKALDEAKQRVTKYNTIMTEGLNLKRMLEKNQQDQEERLRKIAAIEPLQPIADKLQERAETLTQLRIQGSERSSKLRQLQEKRDLLREKQTEREKTAELLRAAEQKVTAIEEHRAEAERLPGLQEEYNELSNRKHLLTGNIQGYKKSRAQSAGGQCPLLHESCLNIKQRGIASLEFYFDGLLKTEHEELAQVTLQQTTVSQSMEAVKPYAEELSQLGQYTERHKRFSDHLQHIAIEITRLEREVASLEQDLQELKLVEQRTREAEAAHNESKKAESKVRELGGLRDQIQHLREQAEQFELDRQERRREIKNLSGSEEQQKQIEAELSLLNDPRSQNKTQLATIAQEGKYSQQLKGEQQQQQEIQTKLQALQEKLAIHATLDADIAGQEAISQTSASGHQNYLTNAREAQLLPEREQAHQQQVSATQQAEETLLSNEQACLAARAAFNQEELTMHLEEGKRLRNEQVKLFEQMQQNQREINSLEQKIVQAEALLLELEAAHKEYQELDDLHTMAEQFRKLIKEAAPHVLKAMLGDISAEANRIFGEVMGDRSAQLSWQNDYEIILRRQGINRTFAQLSGGEQMSAALAVRLALLKKLSTLNIAFFDEPTQNMDELRRMNLAEQIRRVRGFDQLIVISHDDTFEQGLDSLVRLNKINGETSLYLVDDVMIEHHVGNGVATEGVHPFV